MSLPVYIWPFTAIAVPLVAAPGALTAVVLRDSVAGGGRAGGATAVLRRSRPRRALEGTTGLALLVLAARMFLRS